MFNFTKNFKFFAIAYAVIIAAGIIAFSIFGLKLDINFSGGSRFTYTYSDEINVADAEKVIEDTIKKDVNVTTSKALNEDSKKLVVTLQEKDALDANSQTSMLKKLQESFKDNKVELGDSNTVSATVAGSFFAKAIVAVTIAAILVVIYMGLRFKNIGGFRAAITALVALILDVLVTFAVCVFFRLQFDLSVVAVILAILGYSLNDTIVIYNRVRENKMYFPEKPMEDIVNESLNQVKTRTIITTVTTVLAMLTILVVSEIYGLTSLRTFSIPILFSLVSGCVSSLTISAPLWVMWITKFPAKAKKKKR